jgi:RimJ/RimL family protein N-acetyltransferase
MRLRNVGKGDLEAYYRIYCDPVMMAQLGGAQPRDSVPDRLRRHVRAVENDDWWCGMIVPDEDDPRTVAGMVTIDRHDGAAEIGWAVLTEFQRRGIGTAAVRLMLDRARADGRWGILHAFPSVDNPGSNGICRSLGFALVGETESTFAGRMFRSNHWQIEPPDYGTRATAT